MTVQLWPWPRGVVSTSLNKYLHFSSAHTLISIWMAFGGNTRDLCSEKKRTRLRLYTNYLEEKHTVRGDDVANYKRRDEADLKKP
ncbi:hypothetical protein Tco_1025551 [Tanacetum coccineum]